MNAHSEELLRLSDQLLGDVPDLSYLTRVKIERHLFGSCKKLVHALYEYDLQTFELESRQEIERRHDEDPASSAGIETIWMAFELRAILTNLASGDPYLNWELAGPSLPGRTDAIKALGIALTRYARRVSELIGE